MIRLHRCSSSPHNRERGAVLLVVLVMTVLLALFAVQAMRTMQVGSAFGYFLPRLCGS